MKPDKGMMLVMVAGPYSAGTEEQRRLNLDALNTVAASVLGKGHVPVIGLNAALPITEKVHAEERYETTMRISLALAERCDAILMVGESPGALREQAVFVSRGLPVYRSLEEIPESAAR